MLNLLAVLNCCVKIRGRLDFNYCFETKCAWLETLRQAWVHKLGPAGHRHDTMPSSYVRTKSRLSIYFTEKDGNLGSGEMLGPILEWALGRS